MHGFMFQSELGDCVAVFRKLLNQRTWWIRSVTLQSFTESCLLYKQPQFNAYQQSLMAAA